jgi:hypothetical protein
MVRSLFLDDFHVGAMPGLVRHGHAAERHPSNPVLAREHPWEGERVQIHGRSVIDDPDRRKFRMYYLAMPGRTHHPWIRVNGQDRAGHATLPAYAESDDGVRWHKPALGQCTFNDHRDTNLLDITRGMSFEGGVLHDPHDPDPARRYKLLYWDQKNWLLPSGSLHYENWGWDAIVHVKDDAGRVIHSEPYNDWGIELAFSPDGLRWTRHHDYAWRCYSDTGHSPLWDPALGRYVAFGRFGLTRRADGSSFAIGRNVARVTSEDFLRWSEPELVLCVDDRDPPGLQINTMPTGLYEGVYVGLMELFVRGDKCYACPMQLAASRDGRHWTRVADRFDFLPLCEEGAWDAGGGVRPGSGPIPFGDQVYMYYTSGTRIAGYSGIGLATWRRDGFVSLHAGPDGGELLTRPFHMTGRELHLNIDASGGEAQVQVCDMQGRPGTLEEQRWGWSEPIRVDATDATVKWSAGDLATFAGWPRTLRIRLRNADLYSFWME